MKTSVGQYIRQRLKENENEDGIKTMKELAVKAGMNPTYLSRVVKGNIKASPKFLRAIAPHLPGASLLDLMTVADYLTPEDEPENETLEQLEVRIGDLRTKLREAIAKYVRTNDVSEDGYDGDMEIEALEATLSVLVDCVRSGTIRAQFGFAAQQESLDLVKGINSLFRKQKKMLYDFVDEFNRMNSAVNKY